MAVAEYYARNGYKVTPTPIASTSQAFDFIALKEGKTVAVEVKTTRRASFYPMMRTLLKRTAEQWLAHPEYEGLSKIHLVCVLRDDESDYPIEQIYFKMEKLMEAFGDKVEIHIGLLNEENAYIPFRQPPGVTNLTTVANCAYAGSNRKIITRVCLIRKSATESIRRAS
ncbi:hypothetical protein RBU55_03780 [Pseudomonas chlororaphis subsp. aurantiaca]|uniref:hypothetical protein n=1 Tax=Pseudomonas chlororaphis TaxID=587753 RepID=UPI0027DD08B4|nr:hypothetical protein [Pseudomonas chlororaphis]WMJ00686.1 hypothetical protein RBU55_03780 [Pseudomonas chlororaphis subsp. aurantiaca]